MNLDDILFFKENGHVVVNNVFSPQQVAELRDKFHHTLTTIGIDHEKIINRAAPPPSTTRKKSPIANIFYNQFKLRAQLKCHELSKSLMNATFSSGTEPGFEHPFHVNSDHIFPYIDRIGCRWPDDISAEGGLGLHMDRNPANPYGALKKYRPIQSFISLVNHTGNKSGGLQLVPKFHREYDDFFADTKPDSTSSGEFFRMHGKSYSKIQARLETVQIPAGAVVFWDNRLPHATCQEFVSHDSRQVLYFSYLPDIQLNKKYCQQQWNCIKNCTPPPAYDEGDATTVLRDWDLKDDDFQMFNV